MQTIYSFRLAVYWEYSETELVVAQCVDASHMQMEYSGICFYCKSNTENISFENQKTLCMYVTALVEWRQNVNSFGSNKTSFITPSYVFHAFMPALRYRHSYKFKTKKGKRTETKQLHDTTTDANVYFKDEGGSTQRGKKDARRRGGGGVGEKK